MELQRVRHNLATEQQRKFEASNGACHEVMGNITNFLFFFFFKESDKDYIRGLKNMSLELLCPKW